MSAPGTNPHRLYPAFEGWRWGNDGATDEQGWDWYRADGEELRAAGGPHRGPRPGCLSCGQGVAPDADVHWMHPGEGDLYLHDRPECAVLQKDPLSVPSCYCGCHEDAPRSAETTDPDTQNPICWDCLTFAVDEDGETICCRQEEYEEGRPDWAYISHRPEPTLRLVRRERKRAEGGEP